MSTLFEPIPQLKLSDTFYNWWEVTNEISAALNPLNIYDVNASYGITITRNNSGVATFSVDAGCGLRFDGNTLTLGIIEANTASVSDTDWFVFERPNTLTNDLGTTDTTDCEWIRKVLATNILPPTVAGTHTFSGAITVNNNFIAGASSGTSTMQLRSNSIRLGSPTGSTAKSAITSIGFVIDTNDDDPNWIFRGDISGWYTNQNIGISYDQAFVCDAPAGLNVAKFNFAPVTGQHNTQINLLLGDRTADGIVTTDTDEAIAFTALQDTKSISAEYVATNGARTNLFTASYGGDTNLFTVGGEIYINDIQNSSQFLTQSDYSIYKVPLTNTNGVLDYRFTNRLVVTNYDAGLVVGDVVRFNGTNYVAAQANNEANSRVVGVIERIDGGKATITLSGLFTATSLTAGSVYYLSQATAGAVTTTKPTSGLIKEVYVGLSTTSGMLFSSANSSGPTFANVQITGDDLVTADVFGDTLTLTAGSNITIERNTNNDILISAGTLAEAQYFKFIDADVGANIAAANADDTLRITGERGVTTYRNTSNELVIRGGKSFATVQVLGQNTNELDYTVQAITGEDTLYLRSGVGINITSSTDNDILIEATGVSVPADESITNAKLADMQAFSIKAAQANGRPVDVYDISDRLSSQNYTVTGSGTLADPTIYIDLDDSSQYESLQSISGDSVLSEVPHEDIAGYVYGRWTDEGGIISEIQPLGRTELRSIIGASPTGFLEENSNLFNSWWLYESDGSEIDHRTASSKIGKIVFVAGNNISLSTVSVSGNPFAIKIDASGDLGFNRILNNRTGIDIMSGDTSGVIEITDYGAVSVTVDSNNGLTFDVKPESITNEMLANMPFNSIKASVYNTDEPNPIDLSVGTNSIVGRGSGNLKALSGSETREIIGLSSSYYFKTFTIENSSATTIGTINAASGAGGEEFTLRAGSNITLSKIVGTNIVIITSSGGSTGGINTIAVDDIGSDAVNSSAVSSLTFGLVDLNAPTGYGTSGVYKNIDYIPTGPSSGSLGIDIDLGLMPQCSIKVASSSQVSRHGSTGYPAANFVLPENHLLYRSGNAFASGTLSTIANTTGGIAHITSISNGSSPANVTLGSKNLIIQADTNTISNTFTSSVEVSGNDLIFNLGTVTLLASDSSPVLGGNLDINKKLFYAPSSAGLNPSANKRTVAEFVQTRTTTQDTLDSSYFKFDCGSGASNSNMAISVTKQPAPSGNDNTSANRNIEINPLGTGSVLINRISSKDSSNTLTLNSTRNLDIGGTNYLLNQQIYLSNSVAVATVGNVTVGTLGSGNIGKGLYFFASQININNSGSKDIGFVYTKNDTATLTNVTEIGKLITRGNNNKISLFTTTDLVLAAGATASLNDGIIPSSGTGNIQFNSDILLSSKSIKAVNNNITIDTVVNDFTGSLVLKSANKSGYHRVKNGTRPSGNTIHTIDTLPTSSATEKANKYLLYLQDTTTPATCGVIEFLVLANNSVYFLNTTSAILNGSDLINNAQNIIQLRSSTSNTASSPVDQNGQTITTAGSFCGTGTITSDLHIILDPCLSGQYNYTLYKMSIQA